MPHESGTEEVYLDRQRLQEIATVLDILEPQEYKQDEQLLSQLHEADNTVNNQDNADKTEDQLRNETAY
jgi:hypothetical protein